MGASVTMSRMCAMSSRAESTGVARAASCKEERGGKQRWRSGISRMRVMSSALKSTGVVRAAR